MINVKDNSVEKDIDNLKDRINTIESNLELKNKGLKRGMLLNKNVLNMSYDFLVEIFVACIFTYYVKSFLEKFFILNKFFIAIILMISIISALFYSLKKNYYKYYKIKNI